MDLARPVSIFETAFSSATSGSICSADKTPTFSGEVALGPEFGGGTTGDGQKPDEVLVASLRPLGDIGGNRNRGTLHLIAKREFS